MHLENPDTEEVNAVLSKYDLPEDFITDLQDADEKVWNMTREPCSSSCGCRCIIVIALPVSAALPAPLGIMVVQDKVITVSFYDNEILTQYLDGKHKAFDITQQALFWPSIYAPPSTI